MATASLFGAGFAAFFLFAPILSERRGVAPGLLYTVYGIGIIATRIVGSRWLDRVGTRQTLLLSAALLGSGLALAAFAGTPFWLGLAALVIASGSGLFHPVLIAHHARLLPDEPGQATAGFYLGFDLGIGLGSWLLGAVLDLAGLTWLFLTATLLILATVPLLPTLSPRFSGKKQHEQARNGGRDISTRDPIHALKILGLLLPRSQSRGA